MRKLIITNCIIFYLFVANFSFSQDITATQQLPDTVMAGGEYIAEIKINKGDNTNYLKFSQRLPATFTASEVYSKNGKFSFKNGLVRIKWIVPPAEKEFAIKYKVTVAKEDLGDKKIKGRVYYYLNTRKKFFQLDSHTIYITNDINYKPATADSTSIINTQKYTEVIIDTLKPKLVELPIENQKKDTTITTTNITLLTDSLKKDTVVQKNITIEKPAITADTNAVNIKTYRVQILALKDKKYEEIPEVFSITDDKGVTKYFSGNFATYEEAAARKKYMIEIGFEGAFIVMFENGKIVTTKKE